MQKLNGAGAVRYAVWCLQGIVDRGFRRDDDLSRHSFTGMAWMLIRVCVTGYWPVPAGAGLSAVRAPFCRPVAAGFPTCNGDVR